MPYCHEGVVLMTPEEGVEFLLRLGIEVEDERGDELIALCPGHLDRTGRRDSNPSWSMNAESGMHHCFSCGFKGGLLYLVAFQLDFFRSDGSPDWKQAEEWLSTARTFDVGAMLSRLDRAKTHAVPFKPVEMSEARLAIFDAPPDRALRDRMLSREACETHGVLWDRAKSAWVTPIRDSVSGRLLGWQEKGYENRHFRNRPAGIPKSRTMFGLDVWKGGTMIVVESPLDVVRLSTLGISGGVSTFGASVSPEQISLMLSADDLIIAFDNDPAGRKASEFLLAQSRELGFECYFLNYGRTKAKDVGDMVVDEVWEAVDTAKHCVLGRMALT